MMLAAPEFIVAELVENRDEVEVAAELQQRVLADRVVRREKGAEFQTRHCGFSWLRRTRAIRARPAGSVALVPSARGLALRRFYQRPPLPGLRCRRQGLAGRGNGL